MGALHDEKFLTEARAELGKYQWNIIDPANPNGNERGIRGSTNAAVDGVSAEDEIGTFSLFALYELPTLHFFQFYDPIEPQDVVQREGLVGGPEPGFVYVRMRVFLAQDLSY